MTSFEIFKDPRFDVVFNSVATPAAAKSLLRIDVEEINLEARTVIRQVAENCILQSMDPSGRVGLILTEAALGKTHTIVSEILRMLDRDGMLIYPAILQLTANVKSQDIDRWLCVSVFTALESKNFALKSGHSPLRELVEKLSVLAKWDAYKDFHNATLADEIDDDHIGTLALKLADRVCCVIEDMGKDRPDESFVAALFLTAFRLNGDARRWLLGSTETVKLGKLVLDGEGIGGSIRNLSNLALCAGAVDAAILVVFDQIENRSSDDSIALICDIFKAGVGFVESNRSAGLVISAYYDLVETVKHSLEQSIFEDRIAGGQLPAIYLKNTPSGDQLRKSVSMRAEYLLELTHQPPNLTFGEEVAPEWLVVRNVGNPLRDFFTQLRTYRRQCIASGKFLNEGEYTGVVPPPDPPNMDFDKAWADAKDENVGSVENLTEIDRANDLVAVACQIAEEIPTISSTNATTENLGGRFCIQIVDIQFSNDENKVVERWKIGFLDEADRAGRFRDQLTEFLNLCTEAHPAFVRKKSIAGVIDGILTENCQNLRSGIENGLAGPLILKLMDAKGRAIQMGDAEWTRLRLAKKFVENHSDCEGFKEWRRTNRFFFEESGVRGLKELLSPTWMNGNDTEPLVIARPVKPDVTINEPPEVDPRNLEPGEDPRNAAMFLLGKSLNPPNRTIYWNLDRQAPTVLPNFGVLVSGDAGQGKTQILRPMIADAARVGCPILIFDFKNDYAGTFAQTHGLHLHDLRHGVPFNPLRPVPTGPAGCQPVQHIYEVSGILEGSLGLGVAQSGLFRTSLEKAFEDLGIDIHDWQDPEEIPCPSMTDVLVKAEEIGGAAAAALINRLGLLAGLRLLPSDAEARLNFPQFLTQKAVLQFSTLPDNNNLKSALAELILIQAHGYMIRGDQPRALRRLFVFDEAWRAARSKRLTGLAREGRAFGVGVLAGTQFADDLDPDLTGNLATRMHFYNSDANRRKRIVTSTYGTTTTPEARKMLEALNGLQQFEAVILNQHFSPYEVIRTTPYYERDYA